MKTIPKKRYFVCTRTRGIREQCSSFKNKRKANAFAKRLKTQFKTIGLKTKVKISKGWKQNAKKTIQVGYWQDSYCFPYNSFCNSGEADDSQCSAVWGFQCKRICKPDYCVDCFAIYHRKKSWY